MYSTQQKSRANCIEVKDFNLEHSLYCGQAFRWFRHKDWHYGFIKNVPVKIMQFNNELFFDSYKNKLDEIDVLNYFRLDDNLESILKQIDLDMHIKKAINQYHGLRILRQDPFECLMSYICSARTMILQITKMVNNISQKYGEKIQFSGKEFYSFPTSENLSKVKGKTLKEKCGIKTYKTAECFADTAKRIYDEEIDLGVLKLTTYEEAKKELMNFKGVGHKIADCVCLFSLEKLEAFPIDTWIKKIMNEIYMENQYDTENLSTKEYLEISDLARDYFGNHAGYAQEYLFYYYRKK